MERDNYNLSMRDCVYTLSGPVYKKIKTEFIGDNIYRPNRQSTVNCGERETLVDCKGNVKYTLPLDSYKYL